jgi:hypothetical protein
MLIVRAGLCLSIIVSGLALRGIGPGLGLPLFLVKYGGSLLWGAMVFFLVAIAAPLLSWWRIALISAAIAIAVELFRLVHAPLARCLSDDAGGRAVARPHLLAVEFARLWRWNLFRRAAGSLGDPGFHEDRAGPSHITLAASDAEVSPFYGLPCGLSSSPASSRFCCWPFLFSSSRPSLTSSPAASRPCWRTSWRPFS